MKQPGWGEGISINQQDLMNPKLSFELIYVYLYLVICLNV